MIMLRRTHRAVVDALTAQHEAELSDATDVHVEIEAHLRGEIQALKADNISLRNDLAQQAGRAVFNEHAEAIARRYREPTQ